MHGVVPELVSIPDKFPKAILSALDLRADHEEGRLRIIRSQQLHYLPRVHARRIVERQRDDLLFRLDLEEDVGPFSGKVSDEGRRRLVDDVEGNYEEEDEEYEE